MSNVVIFDSVLADLLNDERGPVGRIIRKETKSVERYAHRFVPKDTRVLDKSIVSEMGRDERGMFGQVGSREPYALRTELGFVGVDSLGRFYNQAPQPYLRPALRALGGADVRLTAEEAKDRAGFNERRRRRAGGRTLRADQRQLRRITL